MHASSRGDTGWRIQAEVVVAWERVDLKLDAATFRRLERESIAYEMTFDLKAADGRLKAVVYD